MKEYFQPLPIDRIQNNLYIKYQELKVPNPRITLSAPSDILCSRVIRIFLQDQSILQLCLPLNETLWKVRVVVECKYYRNSKKQLRSTKCDLEWKWIDVDTDWMKSETLAIRWFRNNLRFILDNYTPDSIKKYLGLMK